MMIFRLWSCRRLRGWRMARSKGARSGACVRTLAYVWLRAQEREPLERAAR